MTAVGGYHLKVTIEDNSGNIYYAYYNSFGVGSESGKYILTVGGYDEDLSTLIDSMTDDNNLNGMAFSTKDVDNDKYDNVSCSSSYGGGGGWWYKDCFHSNLHGLNHGITKTTKMEIFK